MYVGTPPGLHSAHEYPRGRPTGRAETPPRYHRPYFRATAEQVGGNLGAASLPSLSSAAHEEVRGVYETSVKKVVEAERW